MVSLIMQTYTPKADIYASLIAFQVLAAVFAIAVFNIAYKDDITNVHAIIMIGVLTLLVGICSASVIEHELTVCRDISAEQVQAMSICKSASSDSNFSPSSISSKCIIAGRSPIASCVVGHITDKSYVDTAKRAGTSIAAMAIVEMVLTAMILLFLGSQFWTHALVYLSYLKHKVKADIKKTEEWANYNLFHKTLVELGYHSPSDMHAKST